MNEKPYNLNLAAFLSLAPCPIPFIKPNLVNLKISIKNPLQFIHLPRLEHLLKLRQALSPKLFSSSAVPFWPPRLLQELDLLNPLPGLPRHDSSELAFNGLEVLLLRRGLGLGLGEGRSGLGLQLPVVFLDFLLAESVDDLWGWLDALFDESAADFVGVWSELSRGVALKMQVERFHCREGSRMGQVEASVV